MFPLRHRQVQTNKTKPKSKLHQCLSRRNFTKHLRGGNKWFIFFGGFFCFFFLKQMISLFLCRTRVHPPTSHYHQDLSHYNLYLCSQMEDSVQELASCVCNYAQVRGCMAVCLGLGFEARKEGRKKSRWGLTGWRWGGPREQGEKRKKQWS